jgi:hypothetical protein
VNDQRHNEEKLPIDLAVGYLDSQKIENRAKESTSKKRIGEDDEVKS